MAPHFCSVLSSASRAKWDFETFRESKNSTTFQLRKRDGCLGTKKVLTLNSILSSFNWEFNVRRWKSDSCILVEDHRIDRVFVAFQTYENRGKYLAAFQKNET